MAMDLPRDRTLWTSLPSHLSEKIFSFLPLPFIFQARLVCKSWRDTLISPRFLHLWSQFSKRWPWFIVRNPKALLAAYDPYSNHKTHIPVCALLSENLYCSSCSLDLYDSILIASSNGLLCFLLAGKRLIVCNPLTQSCQQLPALHERGSFQSVGITTDNEHNSYKIFVFGYSSSGRSYAELYDSSSRTWISLPDPPDGGVSGQCLQCVRGRASGQCVWWNGLFCFLLRQNCMLIYEIHRSQWTNVASPVLQDKQIECLVVVQGLLLLVGSHAREDLTIAVGIWELNKVTLTWKDVGFMPDVYVEKLCRDADWSFLVLPSSRDHLDGEGGYVCFCGCLGKEHVLFHLGQRSWRSPSAAYKGFQNYSFRFLDGLTFQPSFVANV